jgi:hypothetical protein
MLPEYSRSKKVVPWENVYGKNALPWLETAWIGDGPPRKPPIVAAFGVTIISLRPLKRKWALPRGIIKRGDCQGENPDEEEMQISRWFMP